MFRSPCGTFPYRIAGLSSPYWLWGRRALGWLFVRPFDAEWPIGQFPKHHHGKSVVHRLASPSHLAHAWNKNGHDHDVQR